MYDNKTQQPANLKFLVKMKKKLPPKPSLSYVRHTEKTLYQAFVCLNGPEDVHGRRRTTWRSGNNEN
jgi:hypothetical protein